MNRQDEYMEKVAAIVAEHGWMIQAVGASDTEPAFCYTVGLTSGYAHPELVMFGLPFDTSAHLLNDLADRVKDGTRFDDGSVVDDLLQGYSVYLMGVTDPSQHLNVALAYAGRDDVAALQVIWPDAKGNFPWDPGYPEDYLVVPVLGVAP